ncbi:acaefdaf-8f87-4767-b1ce-1b8ae0a60367 [Thermothielavioides terrestris]|uniref:Acaefdaf-8f87-4767-b1ce-1b8ae0a60367 n=1 Tax=Thermothielavioides terrestris TaxID=2587410 RepID=A0A446BQT6_9PEZI|nr:acaefdaf-8f87-4767-b1ce-1b8ae0a60367 [Thermothielavioides terrestris]
MRYRLLSALAAASAAIVADASPAASATYDYIVVGSGPGGGPLAADLARAGYSTLLIEAGTDQGDNPTYADIANFNEAANDETTRWDFWVRHSDDAARDLKFKHTTWDTGNGTFYVGLDPPPGAKLLGIQYPRAATLGGCAMHNAGVCSLPAADDWDTIANRTGDPSWAADNMRKYWKRIEKNEYLPAGDASHGYDGWLATSVADMSWAKNDSLPETRILKKLAELTGQNPDDVASLVNRDILAAGKDVDETTSFYSMVTHADTQGKRSSPNNYIRATLADPAKYPLTVKLNTLVTRVVFDSATVNKTGTTPRAIGVEVMEGGSLYRADPKHVANATGPVSQILARREVIVSGGTFNSPQILKLSGIGPAEELAQFNISVVADLPGVGENLGDNYEGSILAIGAAPVNSGLITLLFRTPSAPTKKRNIFTWCGAFSFEGFWPGFPTDYGPNEYTCAMVHMAPKSQAGSVRLASADPQDRPAINFRFFERHGDEDLRELVEGANLLRASFAAAGAPAVPLVEQHPCANGTADCTDAAQAEFFKLQAYSHHATSTCAIGGDGDRMAVLDSKFRVRGVRGLRVVDASAWPVVPGAFPSCPTMMLSAKAADDIIADAKQAA